jgi:hypothetical protein
MMTKGSTMTSTHPDWDRKLSRSVVPNRAEPMQTLANARSYILALPPGIRHQDDWQRTSHFLMAATASGKGIDIEQATFQLERSLLFHGLLAIP